MKGIIVDVREKDEFKAEHIEGSINIPMSIFDNKGCKKLSKYKKNEINILCRSGDRAKMAEKLIELNCSCKVRVYEGGLIEWKNKGNKTLIYKAFHISIIRQVQIVTGFLILIGVILSYVLNINYIILSGIVGVGLLFAGISGTCMLANLVGKLPFNK